jgi:nucleotide-binding universal stress UspA family protein
MRSPEIIVGIDGSPESEHALRWAAAEAAHRDGELLVLHIYDWHMIGTPAPIGVPFVVDAKGDAEAILAKAVATAREVAPTIAVRGEALLGAAAPTLVAASANGATIVVGNRGRGGFASLVLGSVSQQVALHAHGPVVVVRGRPDPDHGPIVVGVDGSEASQQTLRIAFEAAAAQGAGVFAIRAYLPSAPPYGPDVPRFIPDVPPFAEDPNERREAELATLAADVAPWEEKYPDVHVGCGAIEGHPAEVLAGLSTTARLVVVGNRGHGGFTGLLLGSVGLQLLHHAECPVLIARTWQA